MPNRGKLVVLSFFLLAVALAGGALWYHFAKTRWAMAYWGTEAARLIVRAPEVEVWRLEPVPWLNPTQPPGPNDFNCPSDLESVQIGETSRLIVGRRPLAAAPGLIHMRMALVEDANFDTQAPQPAEGDWDYAFRFSSPEDELIVAIDSQHGLVCPVGKYAHPDRPIATISPIAPGLKKFLEEQFKEAETTTAQPGTNSTEPEAEKPVPMAN